MISAAIDATIRIAIHQFRGFMATTQHAMHLDDTTARMWVPGGLNSPWNGESTKHLEAAVTRSRQQKEKQAERPSCELLAASWSACYAFPEEEAYQAMVDEAERAVKYEIALKQRIEHLGPDTVVVDVGTGPWALLALIAARAGAAHVYAIEANPEAVRTARRCLELNKEFGPRVTILQGLSTEVTLPEKADLLVAEIVGSVATEEAIIATMRDAQQRHLKRPYEPSSYIPVSVATVAAPAAYALHYVLEPPAFDWHTGLEGQPVRCEHADSALGLLAEPAIVEELCFAKPLPQPGVWEATPSHAPIEFEVNASRVRAVESRYYATLLREKLPAADAASLAHAAARALSAVALWPLLQLDEAGEVILCGDADGSHWQTVLPLLSQRPFRVEAGDRLRASLALNLPVAVDQPTTYELRGELLHRDGS